jgi:hypothetical protein
MRTGRIGALRDQDQARAHDVGADPRRRSGDGAGPAAEAAVAYRDAGADLAIMNLPHGAEPAILAPLADALSPLR